jgi:hypothetical protein
MKQLQSLRLDFNDSLISLEDAIIEAKNFGAAYLVVCIDSYLEMPKGYFSPEDVYLGWINEDDLDHMEERLSHGGTVVAREII